MATLGEAFIEVHADTKPFARELGVQLKAILKEVDKTLQGESVQVGQHIAKGVADGVDKDSDRIRTSMRKVGRKIDVEANSWAAKLAAPFARMAKGNFILTRLFGQSVVAAINLTRRLGRLAGAVGKVGVALAEMGALGVELGFKGLQAMVGIAVDATSTLTALGAAGSKVLSSLAALGAQFLAFAPTALAVVGSVFLLVGAFTALAGILVVIAAPFATLLNLALAIPAAFSVILALIAPMIIGFNGLGDAIKVAFEKDPKKFAEGFKQLSPVMQQVVKAIRPLRGEFTKMRDSVQAALIGPILTQLEPALKRILPQLSAAFTVVAEAIGNVLASILRLLSQQATLDMIANIFGQVALFLTQNSMMITNLIRTFGVVAQAALPVVLELFTKFGDFMTRFGAWIEGAISDGRFQGWLDTAVASLKSIFGLIDSIIDLFAEMFGQTDEGGRKFLDKISRTLDKITAWMKSPEGKKSMEDLVDLANLFADALELALKFVKFILNTYLAIAEVIKWIRDHPIPASFITGIGGAVADKFSGGGVVPRDEIAMVHKGEPILDPANSVARNRAILADAGMLDVLQPQAPQVNVFVGNEQLDARTDYRISLSNQRTARALSTGPRS